VHNLVLWKNYTIQTLLKPATIDENLIFPTLIVSSFIYIFCFLIYFMSYYHFHSYYYYFHYYILAENIGHKVEEGYVKISQVNPMITILSYLALLIVFLINLIL
jgi:magnesium-transporting ATPase (P-type)